MPPVSKRAESPISANEEEYLSDDDVAILYQIITTAEEDARVETHPFRAIFAAYDTVLADYGINKDHDRIYLRFLWRLGDKSFGAQKLFEKFEILLSQYGIRLEFDPHAPNAQQSENKNDAVERYEDEHNPDVQSRSRSRSRRRYSFDTVYESSRKPSNLPRRALSHSPSTRTRLTNFASTEPSIVSPPPKAKERGLPRDDRQEWQQPLPDRSRMKNRSSQEELAKFRRESRSVSAQRTPPIRRQRRSPAQENRGRQAPREYQPSNAEAFNSAGSHAGENAEQPNVSHASVDQEGMRPAVYQVSETQMSHDAEVYDSMRIAIVARDCIATWLDQTRRNSAHHQRLAQLAVDHDRGTLLRQGLDALQIVSTARRREREERHIREEKEAKERQRLADQEQKRKGEISRLDEKVQRYQEGKLLFKAFSHWAQSASDEVGRTSVARRHLLRYKYFNAWKDITLANNLEVRRYCLQRFFNMWRRRHVHVTAAKRVAASVYHESLCERSFKTWHREHSEIRAAQWGSDRIKWNKFLVWTSRSRLLEDANGRATEMYENNLKRKYMGMFIGNVRQPISDEQKAENHWRRKNLGKVLEEWHAKTKLQYIGREISGRISSRLLDSTFKVWLLRSRMEAHAVHMDRLRTMRTAFTKWNDRLRIRTIAIRVDERLLLQALYKWVIAERAVLLTRLHERRIKQLALMRLTSKSGRIFGVTRTRDVIAEEHHRQAILHTAFTKWRNQLRELSKNEAVAFGHLVPRMGRLVIGHVCPKLQHIQKLDKWSDDARFFFLTHTCIKRWKDAMEGSKRQKIKDAYSQVRKSGKLNLAVQCLTQWQTETSRILDMNRQAEGVFQDRVISLGIKCFDRWHVKSRHYRETNNQAAILCDRGRTQKLLQQMGKRIHQYQQMNEQAAYFARLHILYVSTGALRKLSIRVFEINTREKTASALEERNERKHLRNTLFHWIERTRQRRLMQNPESPTEQESGQVGGDDGSTTARGLSIDENGVNSDALTAIDKETDKEDSELPEWMPAINEQVQGTPFLGYINTPSKRATRVKALSKITTTPAGTPFTTRLFLSTRKATEPRPTMYGDRQGKNLFGSMSMRASTGRGLRSRFRERPGSIQE